MGWVLGWGVPVGWFSGLVGKAFPAEEHVFVEAGPGALDCLFEAGPFGSEAGPFGFAAQVRPFGSAHGRPFDVVVGYSLGALVLLGEAARVPGKVALLAPIFAFTGEAGLGGRVSRGQVRQLGRWVRRDPGGALRDFYGRAGLDVPEGGELPDVGNLAWGLERLENDRVEPPLPSGWRGWCGSEDPLLDAGRIAELDPAISVVPGGTHHPALLLKALAASLA